MPAETTSAAKRSRRFWPRFTLRVLLVFVTIVGVSLGYWTHRAREQRRVVERIEQSGGMVCYERDGPTAPEPRNFVVEWLAEKMGRDYFERVTAAFVHDRDTVGDLDALHGMESLTIYDSQFNDADLATMQGCGQLRVLQIGDAHHSSDGGARIGDHSLREIAKLPNLEIAHLHGTGFTREGISALANAPKLQQLSIDCCADSVQRSDFDEIKRVGRIHILVAWRAKPDGSGLEKIVEWEILK